MTQGLYHVCEPNCPPPPTKKMLSMTIQPVPLRKITLVVDNSFYTVFIYIHINYYASYIKHLPSLGDNCRQLCYRDQCSLAFAERLCGKALSSIESLLSITFFKGTHFGGYLSGSGRPFKIAPKTSDLIVAKKIYRPRLLRQNVSAQFHNTGRRFRRVNMPLKMHRK